MTKIKSEQLAFYRLRGAGCIFAAICAKNPERYGWHHEIVDQQKSQAIDKMISDAIDNPAITTQSLIFPNCKTPEDLLMLVAELKQCDTITLERDEEFGSHRCIGFRVHVDNNLSWVSGFGNFSFLPKTRQAPYTELVFRVKQRPQYEWHMKKPIEGVIHLADTDMLGVPKRIFRKWWNASFTHTKKVLGHAPNQSSAAKTTFSIPSTLMQP